MPPAFARGVVYPCKGDILRSFLLIVESRAGISLVHRLFSIKKNKCQAN